MKLFLGVPYPIRSNPRGFLFSQSGVDQIKSDILTLLLTNPGERVMNPNYGTPLRTLLFEPNDLTVHSQVKTMITNSIKQWEPRVAILQINVSSNPNRDLLNPLDDGSQTRNILFVQILFVDPQNIKEVQDLELEIPLSGTGN